MAVGRKCSKYDGSEAMVVRLRPECGGRPEMIEIRWE